MRIIGGLYKGRVLAEFKGNEVRPTADAVRESLFNIIGDKIYGADFLDLFCGTGAVGIEALSRGAKSVVFNDISKESAALTRKNLSAIGISSYELKTTDGVLLLSSYSEKFDFIYIDPPYKSQFGRAATEVAASALKSGGVAVFEDEKPFTGVVKGLALTDVRKYGRVYLNFFEKINGNAAVYAGTFDPVTKGHCYLVEAALKLFDNVIVVLGDNPEKTPLYSKEKRKEFLIKTFDGKKNVTIADYSDFKNENEYYEFLLKFGATYYVRGVRNADDFFYEKKAERRNKELYPLIKTVYVVCDSDLSGISASLVRQRLKKGKDVREFLPEVSADAILSEPISKTQPKE